MLFRSQPAQMQKSPFSLPAPAVLSENRSGIDPKYVRICKRLDQPEGLCLYGWMICRSSRLLIHSQNPCCRTFASADAAAFCSFMSRLLNHDLSFIAINCIKLRSWFATVQAKNCCLCSHAYFFLHELHRQQVQEAG